jgi:ribose transport system permease protein
LAFLLAITYFLVSHTPFGRRIQAVGGNSEAAAFSGIKVTRVKLIVYTISGLLASAAGFVTLSRLSSGLPTVAQGIEMDAIASAVLGGTGFNGEGGNIFGTLLGSLVIATITNGLTVLGVDSYLQNVVKGVIIILTVVASVTLAKRNER